LGNDPFIKDISTARRSIFLICALILWRRNIGPRLIMNFRDKFPSCRLLGNDERLREWTGRRRNDLLSHHDDFDYPVHPTLHLIRDRQGQDCDVQEYRHEGIFYPGMFSDQSELSL
jgi:hypothetical protein